MDFSTVMSGGNGGVPAANPTSQQTEPAIAKPGQNLNADAGEGGSREKDQKLAAWTQQLPKEYRENPEYSKALSSYEKLEDFVKSHFELSKKSSIPGEGANAAELDAFWKKLGYPDKPENYAVSKDQNAGTFISAAHEAMLTDKQASALWKAVNEGTARQAQAALEAQRREIYETEALLRKEYGANYQTALELMERGMANSNVKNRIIAAGLAGDPVIAKAFVALGKSQQESGSPQSADGSVGAGDYLSGKWF